MGQRYTNEFKAKVILELLREEKTAAQIAAEHGVHPTQLAQWKKEFLEAMFSERTRNFQPISKVHPESIEEAHRSPCKIYAKYYV